MFQHTLPTRGRARKCTRPRREVDQAKPRRRSELEAADWYRQRADDCEDASLKEILLHNMREEIEHASMLIEWLRRNNPHFAKQLKTYLFTTKDIIKVEHDAEGKG